MSWLPSNDPVLGDARTCDALELIIVPRTRDLGDGFAARCRVAGGRWWGRSSSSIIFVSSSKERIEQAKQDWKTGRFAAVPQEHEFIPLPE